jgi:hypothetical protein
MNAQLVKEKKQHFPRVQKEIYAPWIYYNQYKLKEIGYKALLK